MNEVRFSSADELNKHVEIAKQLRSEYLHGHSRDLRGAKVIASIFGLAILGMAIMGAAGVSLKEVQVSAVQVAE